jgi:hypothetical protein
MKKIVTQVDFALDEFPAYGATGFASVSTDVDCGALQSQWRPIADQGDSKRASKADRPREGTRKGTKTPCYVSFDSLVISKGGT